MSSFSVWNETVGLTARNFSILLAKTVDFFEKMHVNLKACSIEVPIGVEKLIVSVGKLNEGKIEVHQV